MGRASHAIESQGAFHQPRLKNLWKIVADKAVGIEKDDMTDDLYYLARSMEHLALICTTTGYDSSF